MRLLNNLTKFGKAFGQLTHVAQIAAIVTLIVVAFSFDNCNSKTELDNFIVQYESLQETAKHTTQIADSLNKQVIQLSDKAQKQNEKIKKLTINISFKEQQNVFRVSQLSRLEDKVIEAKTDSNLSSVIATQDTIISNIKNQLQTTNEIVSEQREIIQSQNTQILSLRDAVYAATLRGDTLQSIVNALPKTPSNPNKFLFGLIPKPNRTVVGIVAFVAGVTVGNQLGR